MQNVAMIASECLRNEAASGANGRRHRIFENYLDEIDELGRRKL
jgi:hypothetical protein